MTRQAAARLVVEAAQKWRATRLRSINESGFWNDLADVEAELSAAVRQYEETPAE